MSGVGLPGIPLPGTGYTISRVGLGGMMLSIEGRPDREAAKAVIRHAVERGITLIDTADNYAPDHTQMGHNERLIADALGETGLSAGGGSGVVVATKGGARKPDGKWTPTGRPEYLREACHASLRALRTERIVLYHLHTPDPAVPFADSVGALARLREEGKVEAVGLSNVNVQQIRTAQNIVPVASVQNRLSLWDVGYRRPPVLKLCERERIVFLAYSPLGGRRRAGRLLGCEPLVSMGRELRASPHELALAWLLSEAPIVVPIPSATRVSSIESSIRAVSVKLDGAQKRHLVKAFRTLPGSKRLMGRMLRRLGRVVGS